MFELKINGRVVKGEKGETVRKVAERENIHIPTLCFNETLGPMGRCKLCSVSVREGDKTRIVASCLYPVREGMEVLTDGDEVFADRKEAIQAMLALAPAAGVIHALAAAYGIAVPEYGPDKANERCILCSMCVKTCKEVVGVAALSIAGKGDERKVEATDACIGCGACVVVCPTGHIVMEERDGVRTVWGNKFELAKCPKCGRAQAPSFQLEWISKKTGVPMETLMVCQDCK